MDRASGRLKVSMRVWTVAAAVAISSMALAGPASAQTLYKWVPTGLSFSGSDGVGAEGSPAFGGSGLMELKMDQQSDFLYATYSTGGEERLYKFNFAGVSQPFSALAPNTMMRQLNFGGQAAVDNSGLATQGRIYYETSNLGQESIKGFLPSGEPIPGFKLGGSFGELPEQGLCGVAVNPADGHVWTSFSNSGSEDGFGSIREFDTTGKPTGTVIYPHLSNTICDITFDTNGNIYVDGLTLDKVDSATGEVHRGRLDFFGHAGFAIDQSTNELFIDSNANVVHQLNPEGGLIGTFSIGSGSGGIVVDMDGQQLYVTRNSTGRIEQYERTEPKVIPLAKTEKPDLTKTSAILHGVVDGDGINTTNCKFEWSTGGAVVPYNQSVPCLEGNVFSSGSGPHSVHAEISGLTEGTEYFVRLATGSTNGTARGVPVAFKASTNPVISLTSARNVDTGGAILSSKVAPNGSDTRYRFEWGAEAGNYTHVLPVPGPANGFLKSDKVAEVVEHPVIGLTSATTYHFQVVAENDAGTTETGDKIFTTYDKDPTIDFCDNAHVRQQTGSRFLANCRAYELVSDAHAGGYDVESDLVSGQEPLVSSSTAKDSLLYSLNFGAIPSAVNPTNVGHDPYVAKRTEDGWRTEYVGLDASGMADKTPYGSPLLGTDGAMETFAFGGEDICDPCFPDNSINVPLRKPDGSLVKGMAGTINPAADPAGEVRKPLSENGSHLIFGSEQKFETAGNSGSVSIYDRNLDTKSTQVVSTMPNGSTMTGTVAELDVSADGSRVLIGKKVSQDAQGNGYYDLYMHVGTSPNSVEVLDSTSGAVFNGMTADGTKVFFSTPDALSGDTDTSVDLYRADVGPASATVSRVSTGTGAGNTDACTPPGTPNTWNSASGNGKCGVLAFAGGAGVAAEDGTVYFLSPEKLDGDGETDQANLFVASPGGSPEFVATIDNTVGKAPPPPPNRPVEQASFSGGTFELPIAVAVDQSNGDVYVGAAGAKKVFRYDSTGAAKNFTAGPGSGTNALPNLEWPFLAAGQVAIDNSGGPANGDIYVVSQNESFESKLSVYAPTGALLTTLTGTGTPGTTLGFACGVSVDQANGNIYIGDYFGNIWRYTPAANPVAEANYSGGINTGGAGTCQTAAAGGKVYVASESGQVKRFEASAFALGIPPTPASKIIDIAARGVAVDPATGNVFVPQGTKISVYDDDPAATLLETFGSGKLTESTAVATRSSNQHVFATSSFSKVVEFGHSPNPYTPIDHHAIVDATKQSEVHNYGDFQVSPGGNYAIFDSTLTLTSYPLDSHRGLYRYDQAGASVDCVSCPASGITVTTGVSLPAFGLALADDGRVFFSSSEQLVLRDTNGVGDAYQWEDGKTQLISTGIARQDAGILGVSNDGTDAFFFTRETLAAEDENGSTMKIYDAREDGGFPSNPKPVSCQAADECRGAGSQPPGPPSINTATGEGGRSGSPCSGLERRASSANKRVKSLRKRAAASTDSAQAQKLRRQAGRLERKAKRLQSEARSCRQSSGGNGR
jgi:hypothetical protein